jgi:hypothetical protein
MMSRQDDKKRHGRGLKVAGTLSVLDEADHARPASEFHKRSWPRSKKDDLAD